MAGSFRFKQFEVRNERSAMKVGTDGVLLGAWASVNGREKTILDVGTGTGVIALMLAQRVPSAVIKAIDIDRESVEEASGNFASSPWSSRLEAMQYDFRNWNGKADLIVCNPPFFTNALKAPEERRSAARHNDTLSHRDLIDGALRCLEEEGRLAVVLPCDEAEDFIASAESAGLNAFRICRLFTSERKPPKRTLMEFSTKKTPPAQPEELVIESPDYKSITKDFYLKY